MGVNDGRCGAFFLSIEGNMHVPKNGERAMGDEKIDNRIQKVFLSPNYNVYVLGENDMDPRDGKL